MSLISLDFESPYASGARKEHYLHRYSLTNLTYEEYILDPRFKLFGCAIKIDDGGTVYYREPELTRVLNFIFQPGNDHTMIAHNAMFDAAILSWHYNLHAKAYWCTRQMCNALWPQRKANLKHLAVHCYPDDPTIRKGEELANFKNLYELDAGQEIVMEKYCINDVDVMWECLKVMWPVMPDTELELLDLTLQCFVHPAFHLDKPKLLDFLEEYNAETARIIAASGVSRAVLASPKQFVAWVKENLDLDIPIIIAPTDANPDHTKPALGKDEIAFINFRQEHAEYEAIWQARLRVASTIARSRAERMLRHSALNGDRLAMPLNYYAAHTGRWGGTNKLNPQNFQRGSVHRKALLAPPGYQVIVADQSNIEGRMNAWFNKETKLLDVFKAGGCIYNDFASTVFGYPVDRKKKAQDDDGNFLDADGNITDYDHAHEPMWTEGFLGKTCQLGLGFGVGPPKLRNTLWINSKGVVDFSLEQCKQIVYEDWRGTYTNIVNGWAEADHAIYKMHTLDNGSQFVWNCLVVEPGRMRLPNGMYLNYPELKCEVDEYDRPQYSYWNGKHRTNIYGGKLIENVVQAIARLVIAQNILDTNRWLLSNQDRYGQEARVVLTVHDEILALALTEHAQEVLDHIIEMMAVLPDWCDDGTLVLAAEGGYDTCYSK